MRGVLAVTVALIVAVVVSLAVSGPAARRGCLDTVFAGPVGAEQVHSCGAGARAICRAVGRPGGYAGDAARTLAQACRKAGFDVGS